MYVHSPASFVHRINEMSCPWRRYGTAMKSSCLAMVMLHANSGARLVEEPEMKKIAFHNFFRGRDRATPPAFTLRSGCGGGLSA